ncbi:hypothetical protein B1NLA3E_01355 [Bacillus sp. 1NLA3E]|nr:hypothetical protein B1NLA3E_01355 [Bacillus sp. 1NLA3E]
MWYGLKEQFNHSNEINKCLNNLLSLYKDALHNYFQVSYSKDFFDFFTRVKEQKLKNHDKLFVEWLEKNGIESFKILNNNIKDNPQLISSLEYEEFLLISEMSMEYPEDLRDCLISISNNIDGYIKPILETSSALESIYNSFTEQFFNSVQRSSFRHAECFSYIRETINVYDKRPITLSRALSDTVFDSITDYSKKVEYNKNFGEKTGSAYKKAEPIFVEEKI